MKLGFLRGRLAASALLCLLCLACRRPVAAQGLTLEDTGRLVQFIQNGRYDAAIAGSTALMNKLNTPHRTLLYLRGFAEWRNSWFGAAQADLAPLGDYRLNDLWAPASGIVAKIAQMRALCPPRVQEVMADGAVAFRVYYDEDNAWTQAIIKLLPKAYEVGQDMFGVATTETAVFIFTDSQRCDAFFRLRFEADRHSWVWAHSALGIMVFCETDPKGRKPAENVKGDYFRGTIAHEYAHALLARILGTAPLPTWLNEGIAMLAGSRIAPHDLTTNDQVIKQCFTGKAILSLEELNNSSGFYDSVERQLHSSGTTTDAYEQGFHMVRYLTAHATTQNMFDFLNLLAETRDANNAFMGAFGFDMQDFYASWLHDSHKVPAKQQ